MTSRRVLFSNWIIYILVLLIMHFWENVCIIDFTNPIKPFSFSELSLLFLGIILITAIYFYIEKKRNGFKPNFVILSLCGLIFLYSLFVLLATPSVKEFDFYNQLNPNITYHGVFNVTLKNRIYYIFFAFSSMLVTYLSLDVFPRKIAFLKIFDIGFYIGLSLTLVCMIYSYIVEFDQYVTIIQNFNQGIIKEYIYSVKSFWFNRSNYSMLLMFMIFYCLLLHYSHQKWWWLYLIATFLFLNMLFTTSKTNIPLSLFLILAYLLARFFITFKKHKLRNIITLASVFSTIIALSITFYLLYNYSPISDNLHESIEGILKAGENTISSRKYIWKAAVDILNNSNWLLGAGFGLFNDLLREYLSLSNPNNVSNMPHNYFVQIVGEGGIFYLAFIFFTFVLLIYCMVRIAKKHTSLVVLESLFLITLLVHASLETSGPIAHSLPSGEGILYTYLLFVPIFSIYYHQKHENENLEIIKESEKYSKIKNKYFNNVYSLSNFMYLLMTIFFILLLGPILTFFKDNVSPIIIVFLVIYSLIYLFMPYCLQRIYNKQNNVSDEYNSIFKYIRIVLLPFLINFVIGASISRIYMSVLTPTFGTMMLMIFINIIVYISSFIFIPYFKKNGEVIYVFFANFNNKTLKVYSHFLTNN